jgi:hypothetical protein
MSRDLGARAMRGAICAAALAFAALSFGCGTSGADPAADSSATFPAEALTVVTSDGGAARIEVRMAPSQPPIRGVNMAELTVTDANGTPLTGLSITMVPWMPAHGHGASTKPEITEKSGGRYVATDVNLPMPGRWDLRMSLSGEVNDRATASLDVP